MSKTDQKDRWDKFTIIGKILIIPITALTVSYFANEYFQKLEVKTKTLDIAISVLSTDPNRKPQIQPLREWAVKVVDEYTEDYSKFKLSEEAKNALLKNQILIYFSGQPLMDEKGRMLLDEQGRPIIGERGGLSAMPAPAEGAPSHEDE